MAKLALASGTIPATILLPAYSYLTSLPAYSGLFVGQNSEAQICGVDPTIEGVGIKCAQLMNQAEQSFGIPIRYTYTGYIPSPANLNPANRLGVQELLFTVTNTITNTVVSINSYFVSVLTLGGSCPANSDPTPPNCTCNTSYVPDPTGTSCVSGQYTITLSAGTSVEPWHKKWDQDHTSSNSNLPYKAMVKDQNGQPKAGITVTITSDVTPGSGGHAHDDINRPKGWLAKTPAEITAQIQAGATQGSGTLGGVTDSTGTFSFTFGAEEASGEHTITAECKGCSNNPQNATINVEIPGLMQLGADPLSYELRGETDSHPGNHYFSPAAIVKIINLAFAYRLSSLSLLSPLSSKHQLLKINDSSLVKGGVFDLKLDWTYPNGHQGHRKGTVVDINNYHAPSPRFEDMAANSFIQAQWHRKGTAPHYHLLLLGKDE